MYFLSWINLDLSKLKLLVPELKVQILSIPHLKQYHGFPLTKTLQLQPKFSPLTLQSLLELEALLSSMGLFAMLNLLLVSVFAGISQLFCFFVQEEVAKNAKIITARPKEEYALSASLQILSYWTKSVKSSAGMEFQTALNNVMTETARTGMDVQVLAWSNLTLIAP